MTKILYVPTGRYLEYCINNKFITSVILEDVLEQAAKQEIKNIVKLNKDMLGRSFCSRWIEANNIRFPISEHDFEIIYD